MLPTAIDPVGSLTRALARIAYRRHRTPIVAITGSVGKTLAKEWTADVLQTTFRVVRTPKNQNTRRSVPAVLLGIPEPERLRDLARASPRLLRALLLSPPIPDYYVLEVGTTAPGVIPRHMTVFTPMIAVVTTIAPAHLEALGSLDGVAREKGALVAALPADGHAVLRYDDPRVREMATLHRGRTVFYGFAPEADVRMDEAARVNGGLATTLRDPAGARELFFPHLVNRHHLYAVMVAWCVGSLAGVDPERMAAVLQAVEPRIGRGTLMIGPRGSLVYDDSFNANPASMLSACEAFEAAAGQRRKLVILGDMLELGEESTRWHREVGCLAARYGDALIAVGRHAGDVVESFRAAAPGAPAHAAATVGEALAILQHELRSGDAVLLKASHGVHLDRLRRQLSLLE